MQTIEQEKNAILSLLHSHNRMYTNPNDVIIYLDSCGAITVAFGHPYYHPEDAYTSLSFWKEFPTIDFFEKTLYINSRRNLDNINYRFLKRQFDQGKIDMSCYVELNGLGFTQFFRKQGAQLFAYDSENSEMHKVNRRKITPTNFVDYTMEFATHRKVSSTSSTGK